MATCSWWRYQVKHLGSMSYNEVRELLKILKPGWLDLDRISKWRRQLTNKYRYANFWLALSFDLKRQECSKLSVMIVVFYNSRIVKFGSKPKLGSWRKHPQEVYNTEFILMGYLRLQQLNWTNWFVRLKLMEIMILFHKISATGRKIQIIKQYNNMNEKV